mmetsp:Transcript_54715/g.140921  ORF Transcript_54715/g.140921 Transcript_54715/m.140921 type:complete len:200 (+) Transcript_54715:188-787(+)
MPSSPPGTARTWGSCASSSTFSQTNTTGHRRLSRWRGCRPSTRSFVLLLLVNRPCLQRPRWQRCRSAMETSTRRRCQCKCAGACLPRRCGSTRACTTAPSLLTVSIAWIGMPHPSCGSPWVPTVQPQMMLIGLAASTTSAGTPPWRSLARSSTGGRRSSSSAGRAAAPWASRPRSCWASRPFTTCRWAGCAGCISSGAQ